MTVLAFVLMLSIPVAMLAKKTPASAVLIGIWGLFLGMTPLGTPLASALNELGASILGAVAGA
jgi:hypothetical protein